VCTSRFVKAPTISGFGGRVSNVDVGSAAP
jgi:hypothetical protein